MRLDVGGAWALPVAREPGLARGAVITHTHRVGWCYMLKGNCLPNDDARIYAAMRCPLAHKLTAVCAAQDIVPCSPNALLCYSVHLDCNINY